MSGSLERHLSRTLVLAVVVTGLVAGILSLVFAYEEAQEFQDGSLRKIAVVAHADRLDGLGRGGSMEDGNDVDPEDRVWIARLPAAGDATMPSLSADLAPGFHTLNSATGGWRVFVRQTASGTRIAVAQETAVRNEMAMDSALRTLAPLIALIPLLAWIALRIVRRELRPLRHLAHSLDSQPEECPAHLPDAEVPDEVRPFIVAIDGLLSRVNRLVSEQRRFIADAAHELRTPLTALSLQAQNLAQAESREVMHERLQPLQSGIERARRMTVQLLDLARLQSSEKTSKAFNVPALARDLVAEFLPLAEVKHIDLGMEEAGLISMRSDSQALMLIIRNALENAIKYAPPGGEVTLVLKRKHGDDVIEVIDNGPGIPPAELEHVFEAFHRAPNAKGEGSGLGLSIAREAASRMGGAVSLRNREGASGLIFSYRQPEGGETQITQEHHGSA